MSSIFGEAVAKLFGEVTTKEGERVAGRAVEKGISSGLEALDKDQRKQLLGGLVDIFHQKYEGLRPVQGPRNKLLMLLGHPEGSKQVDETLLHFLREDTSFNHVNSKGKPVRATDVEIHETAKRVQQKYREMLPKLGQGDLDMRTPLYASSFREKFEHPKTGKVMFGQASEWDKQIIKPQTALVPTNIIHPTNPEIEIPTKHQTGELSGHATTDNAGNVMSTKYPKFVTDKQLKQFILEIRDNPEEYPGGEFKGNIYDKLKRIYGEERFMKIWKSIRDIDVIEAPKQHIELKQLPPKG
jgi:hypothetical protein